MLGSVEEKRIVELGAGIGRFTGALAATARSVTAVDFMPHLIQENERVNAHRSSCLPFCLSAVYQTVVLRLAVLLRKNQYQKASHCHPGVGHQRLTGCWPCYLPLVEQSGMLSISMFHRARSCQELARVLLTSDVPLSVYIEIWHCQQVACYTILPASCVFI